MGRAREQRLPSSGKVRSSGDRFSDMAGDKPHRPHARDWVGDDVAVSEVPCPTHRCGMLPSKALKEGVGPERPRATALAEDVEHRGVRGLARRRDAPSHADLHLGHRPRTHRSVRNHLQHDRASEPRYVERHGITHDRKRYRLVVPRPDKQKGSRKAGGKTHANPVECDVDLRLRRHRDGNPTRTVV